MANEQKREKSQGFLALGIPVGSPLTFKKDPTITVKTLNDKNKVEYQGLPYSLSTLATQLVGSPVSGYLYFKFEGKVLKTLMKSERLPRQTPKPIDLTEEEIAEIPNTSIESDKSEVKGELGQVCCPVAVGQRKGFV
jgi:hypothetical protein